MGGDESLGTVSGAGGSAAGSMSLYNPNYNYGGGGGWQGPVGVVGNALSNADFSPRGSVPQFSPTQSNYVASTETNNSPGLIPDPNQGTNIDDLIRRLIGGLGGYQTSGFKMF